MFFFNVKDQIHLIKRQLNKRIDTIYNHGQFILGPEVNVLEKKLAKIANTNHCLTVSSGTDALLVSLMALNIKSGDEVITTSFSYISTAEVIVRLGAIPVFIDINKNDCLIDHKLIQQSITKKTKAIIAVSLFGQAPDWDIINNIAKKNGNIPVIEDAAQSFGSEYKGYKSCGVSTIGCTSFFPTKPLSCFGDGGAIFTNNKKLFKKLLSLRVHGQIKKYEHEYIGVSARMDTIQCAVVLSKLKLFNNELKSRQRIAKIYDKAFQEMGIDYVKTNKKNKSAYALYCIFIKNRNKIQLLMKKENIPSAVYYPKPMNKQKPYKKYDINSSINACDVSMTILAIPMGPYLKLKDQNKIINFFKRNLKLC